MRLFCTTLLEHPRSRKCGGTAIRFYKNKGSGRYFCRCRHHKMQVSFKATWEFVTKDEYVLGIVAQVMEA